MEVTVMSATEKPIETCSLAAGGCYGKDNVSRKRLESCVKSGHTSTIEFAHIVFSIKGVSRSLLAQLTRHRLMSFAVESQRYCKYDLSGRHDWYVTPDAILAANEKVQNDFRLAMSSAAIRYQTLLDDGMRPEDARYVLPEATKTNLTCGMNGRELLHFLQLRTSKRASKEIQDLALAMVDAARGVNEEWDSFMDILMDNMTTID